MFEIFLQGSGARCSGRMYPKKKKKQPTTNTGDERDPCACMRCIGTYQHTNVIRTRRRLFDNNLLLVMARPGVGEIVLHELIMFTCRKQYKCARVRTFNNNH